jgi:hypothetical protein
VVSVEGFTLKSVRTKGRSSVMHVKVGRIYRDLNIAPLEVSAEAEVVVVDTFGGVEGEHNITLEAVKDGSENEVRIIVDGECVWSALGFE